MSYIFDGRVTVVLYSCGIDMDREARRTDHDKPSLDYCKSLDAQNAEMTMSAVR